MVRGAGLPRSGAWSRWWLRRSRAVSGRLGWARLYNLSWKKAPSFGQDTGLFRYTSDAVSHPVFPPYSWLVEHVILPNFQAFGWVVLVIESLLAVLLITGLLTRLAAGIGVLQSLAIALSVANAPNEWPWSYWLMIAAHLVLLTGAGSQGWGPDSALSTLNAAARGRSRLTLGWGIIGVVTAAWAIVGSWRSGSPTLVGSKDLAVSVGSYGVSATVAIAVVGLLLGLSSVLPVNPLRQAAGIVAAVAAVGVYAQVIDGSNTTAAFFLCFLTVAAILPASPAPNQKSADVAVESSDREAPA